MMITTNTSNIALALVVSCALVPVVVGKHLQINISLEAGNDTEDCLNGSVPCLSLDYVSQQVNNLSFVEILLSAGLHEINGVALYSTTNITLRGGGSPISGTRNSSTVLRCHGDSNVLFNNVAFFNSSNVIITDITFEGCGPIASALYVRTTNQFYVSNCVFQHNIGRAVLFLNSTNVLVKDSVFLNNSGQIFDDAPLENREEYGFIINQSFGAIGIIYRNYKSSPKFTIQGCMFDSNHARRHPLNANDARPSDYQPFGTGGGIFIRFSNATCGNVEIIKCQFNNNTALVRGGGIYVSFWGYSSNNFIIIRNSSFDNNYCNDTGGAISLNSFPSGFDNFISVMDCNFTRNMAELSSGAIMYQFINGIVNQASNRIEIKRCTFKENYALSASAASFTVFSRIDQRSQPVLIEDIIFDGNIAVDTTSVSVKRNIVSSVLTEIPLVFKGVNQFTNNKGGGVTIAKERIDIHDVVIFENNFAANDSGGGLSVEDTTYVQLFSGSSVIFRNNSAYIGGGISVPTPAVYKDTDVEVKLNSLCFLQYEELLSPGLAPEHWNLTMSFEDNQVSTGGGAVYTNDVSSCAYVPSYENNATIQSLPLFNRSLFTLPQFMYSANRITGQLINGNNPTFFSGASDLNITVNVPQNTVALCEIFECAVQSFDQSGNTRSALFKINAGDLACSNQRPRIYSVINMDSAFATVYDIELMGHCDGFSSNRPTNITYAFTYSVIDEITGDALPEQHLEVNISCCHTGYVYDESQKKCVFDTSHSIFVAESLDKRYVYIKTRFFGQHFEDNQFFSAVVPSSYYTCNVELGSTIQGCLFKFDHPYEQCIGNRTGFLCGQCPPPEGLTLNLRECQECETSHIIYFILFCILVMTVSLIIMTFDIGLSNKFRGFLFFSQVVSTVYQRNSGGGIDLDYHLARQFGISMYLPICLSRNMDALSVTLLGLCVPLMMFMTIVLFIFLARHIRYLSHHQTINGIWLLIFLIYVYATRTSFDLIRCVPLYDVDDNLKEYRYFYDGSIKCFEGKHLIYMFISLLLIFTVIIPGPCIVALISYRHFNRTAPFRDVATKRIKRRYWWWSSYDLVRRLAYIVIVIFEGYLFEYHQLILTFVTIAFLVITARLHPYEGYWSNIIETLVLLDLSLIAGYFVNDQRESVKTVDFIPIVLLVIPFVYGTLYIVVSIFKKIWHNYCSRRSTETDKGFVIVSSPREKIKWDDSDYHEYRDELLVVDSL